MLKKACIEEAPRVVAPMLNPPPPPRGTLPSGDGSRLELKAGVCFLILFQLEFLGSKNGSISL